MMKNCVKYIVYINLLVNRDYNIYLTKFIDDEKLCEIYCVYKFTRESYKIYIIHVNLGLS